MKKPFVWFLLLVTLSLEAYGSSLRDDITTSASEQYGKNLRTLQEGESGMPQNTTGPIGSDNSTWSPYQLESTTSDPANSNSANEPFVLESTDTNSTNSTNPEPVSDDTSDDKTAANRTVIIVVAIVCAVCIIGLGLLLFRIQSMRKAQLEAEAKESQNVIELNNTSSASTMKINESFQVFDRKNDSVSVIVNIDPKLTPTTVYVNNEIL